MIPWGQFAGLFQYGVSPHELSLSIMSDQSIVYPVSFSPREN